MPSISLRAARTSDAARISEIYAPYVRETKISFETQPPTPAEMARRIVATTKSHPWLVCEVDGAVCGYAYAHAYGTRACYNWSAELSVYIAPSGHRKGAGRRLYTALEGLLRAQGIRSAYALVTSPNPASDAFHAAMGYTQQGFFPDIGYKFGGPVGVTYYAKPLLPPCQNPPAVIPYPALPENTVAAILQSGE